MVVRERQMRGGYICGFCNGDNSEQSHRRCKRTYWTPAGLPEGKEVKCNCTAAVHFEEQDEEEFFSSDDPFIFADGEEPAIFEEEEEFF